MIPTTVRVIALDAAGTIMEPSPAVHFAYCQVASAFGYALDAHQVKQRFPAAMKEFFPLSWESRDARTDQHQQWHAWRGLVAKVLHEIPKADIEPVFMALWDHFRHPQHWRIFPDVEPTIKALKEKGYRVCVVSNFDQRLYDIAAGSPELASVDHWFASVDVGYQKPCAEFFRTIEHKLNVESHQFLMIGDSLEADYQGAIHAQWHARWLNRDAYTIQTSHVDSQQVPMLSFHTLRSLQDLFKP